PTVHSLCIPNAQLGQMNSPSEKYSATRAGFPSVHQRSSPTSLGFPAQTGNVQCRGCHERPSFRGPPPPPPPPPPAPPPPPPLREEMPHAGGAASPSRHTAPRTRRGGRPLSAPPPGSGCRIRPPTAPPPPPPPPGELGLARISQARVHVLSCHGSTSSSKYSS